MPRRRKVPITKGEKRIVGSGDAMRIEQTLFCGECGRQLKTATTQKPHTSVARVCDNIENHMYGKIYLWTLPNVSVPIFEG
jgi:NADH pyrophosphatase NudC (nudix superfamily)